MQTMLEMNKRNEFLFESCCETLFLNLDKFNFLYLLGKRERIMRLSEKNSVDVWCSFFFFRHRCSSSGSIAVKFE